MACTATKSTSPRLGLGREGESPNRVGYVEGFLERRMMVCRGTGIREACYIQETTRNLVWL